MNNIFVTSDLFLGKTSKALNRKFLNIESMNLEIIKKWNQVVNTNDTVYILGNFCWDPITCTEVIPNLNGKIKLLRGEFDKSFILKESLFKNVEVLNNDIIEVKLNNIEYILSHYPLEYWKNKNENSIHLHGSNIKIKSNLNKMNRFNVMIELWGYKPINILEFNNLIEDYKLAKKVIKNDKRDICTTGTKI